MKKFKKIPSFKTENEEREFWESHDSSEYLDLSNNLFGAITATALAEGLATNEVLQVLNVSFNALEIKGTHALIGACAENTSLRELWLQNTCWRNDGFTPRP